MAADLLLKASVIITMDDAHPRVEAIAVDTSTGQITAVGTLAEVQASASGVAVTDLGSTVLMPGFIDPHSHPVLAGVSTQEPAHWIAPYVGYGLNHLVFHAPGHDQRRFLELFERDLLPRLRKLG